MFRFLKMVLQIPMMLLMVCLVLVYFSATAKADEFFLAADGAHVEKRVSSLEKRIAALENKLLPASAPGATSRGPVNPISPTKIRWQLCVGGVCQAGECENVNQVPLGATILNTTAAATSSPCPTGPCGDGCICFGAGYYCADGKCPVSFGVTANPIASSYASETTGWFLGKNLGRKKRFGAGSGCSTCGQ